MQFGMLRRVDIGNHVGLLDRNANAPAGRDTLGVSGSLKSTVKHAIWGLGKWVSCGEMDGQNLSILTIYTSYDVFSRKDVHFREFL